MREVPEVAEEQMPLVDNQSRDRIRDLNDAFRKTPCVMLDGGCRRAPQRLSSLRGVALASGAGRTRGVTLSGHLIENLRDNRGRAWITLSPYFCWW